jgi:membrane associated rhomboid family serine protease
MRGQEQVSVGFPKPGKALLGAMILVGALWLFFATGINWAGSGESVFALLVGSDAIGRGEVWRLFTASLVHQYSGPGAVGHLITTLLGLYFLGSSLEQSWGPKRFILFLIGSGVLAFALQFIVGSVITTLHQPVYYGGLGVVDAIAIAWAMSFKDRQVRLMFVLPVTGRGLMIFVLVMNILYVFALDGKREGLVTPFGGMLAGWLFADGSPARRWYLQWKLRRLQAEGRRVAKQVPHLKVIRGGGGSDKPDKRMLN